jgi:cytochrome c oxidase subunit III
LSASTTEAVAQHALQHHFSNMEQQRESTTLGMWIFLVTEIMFFGGLFTAYLVYRLAYPDVWEYCSRHSMEFKLGTINTTILLCSSLTVALSVHAIQLGRRKICAILLFITVLMGFGFLVVKSIEYHHHYVDGSIPGPWWHMQVEHTDGTTMPAPHQYQLFFYLYFVMTGLHALHVTIGIVLLAVIALWAWQGKYTAEYHNPVHISGLYWHFVDLVWIFLFPLLYLIAGK